MMDKSVDIGLSIAKPPKQKEIMEHFKQEKGYKDEEVRKKEYIKVKHEYMKKNEGIKVPINKRDTKQFDALEHKKIREREQEKLNREQRNRIRERERNIKHVLNKKVDHYHDSETGKKWIREEILEDDNEARKSRLKEWEERRLKVVKEKLKEAK